VSVLADNPRNGGWRWPGAGLAGVASCSLASQLNGWRIMKEKPQLAKKAN